MITGRDFRDRVMEKLIAIPSTRDSDHELIWELWMDDLALHNLQSFGEAFKAGKLFHPESARRYRQLLQMKHPELRGTKYNQRHEHAEKVKESILTN